MIIVIFPLSLGNILVIHPKNSQKSNKKYDAGTFRLSSKHQNATLSSNQDLKNYLRLLGDVKMKAFDMEISDMSLSELKELKIIIEEEIKQGKLPNQESMSLSLGIPIIQKEHSICCKTNT